MPLVGNLATRCPPTMPQLKSIISPLVPKASMKKFSVCPKCAYSTGATGSQPVHLPAGINPTLLLDNSPTPQLLLSESNVIVYANKSAARVVKVKQQERQADAGKSTAGVPPVGLARGQTNIALEGNRAFSTVSVEAEPADAGTGLEGRTLDQLNFDLTDDDMTRWVSLVAVYTNVKLSLGKRETKRREQAEHAVDDMYGESSKWNHDYYGELEKAKVHGAANADTTLRETLPIAIIRADGTKVKATMYVSLIDPYSTGYSYSAVSIIPDVGADATFTEQVTVPDEEHKHRFITGLHRGGRHRKKPKDFPENVAGDAGHSFMKRVRVIKDLILDEMEYCFIALSPDGDVVITNKATKIVMGAEMLEASMGEGFDWIARLNIWRPDFSEPLPFQEWALNRLLTEQKPLTQTIGLWAGDIPLTVELRGKCIYQNPEKEEGLIAALAMVVDQTAWAEKEKNLRGAQVMQDAFLTNVSRNLKTPLSAIIGLLELAYRDTKLDDEQRTIVLQMFGAINSLLLVVNDIVNFTQIQQNTLSVSRGAFVLQDLIDDIKVLFEKSMAKEGISFKTDFTAIGNSAFGDGKRMLLLGDDAKIRKILINLLSNAFKFTPSGEVKLRVLTQKHHRASLEVRFEIIDSGIGLSKEDQEAVFMAFEETYMAKQDSSGVVGFGLSIAKKFTSILAGDIGISNSAPGRGSTFWFSVPCGRPSPDAKFKMPAHEDMLSKTMGIVIQPSEIEVSTPKEDEKEKEVELYIEGTVVLLVEDNWTHQLVMQKRLQRLGCAVVAAVNGQDALEILKKRSTEVDLVFTDLQMPLLDGFETTRLIRTDPDLARFRHVPVIGVTSTDVKGQREKATACGIDEFTLKPLTDVAIKELIVKAMDPVGRALKKKATLPP